MPIPLHLIHIEQHYEYRQTGWAIGPCEGCGTFGVVRIEDLLRVTSGFPFPSHRQLLGELARCDFCERQIERNQASERLDLEFWTRNENVQKLAERLGVPPPGEPDRDNARRLYSLLNHVAWNTQPWRVDTSKGIKVGMLVGAIGGAFVGHFWLQRIFWRFDALGAFFAGVLGGFVLGAIFGAFVWALWRQISLPARQLRAAYLRYPFNCKHLVEQSLGFGWRIRHAALGLCDEVSHGRFPPLHSKTNMGSPNSQRDLTKSS